MDGNKGQNLKGYELRDRLGAGGFGAVYRAYQSTVGREVAIKIILPGLANQPEFIRRFEGEAQLVARLEHPHITPLYDYWRDPDGAYLVMRWLRGGSLRDALQNGPYALPAACTLLEQVAGALSLAHRSGVIHRDIKPGNILLDEDGNAYLTDFGIAKDLNVPSSNTQQDAIIGSLDYISPEQARSEPVTPRTDIYSLGVTLYEMITGEHPFGNISSVERLFKHINDPLPEIITLDAKVSAKNPEGRYPDALAFAADFREAIGLNRTSTTAVELLTQREHEILNLIIEGLSNKEIAQKLTVTLGTVKWYVNQIYSKLGVRSRVQAIVRAREMNLIVKAGQEMPLISLAPTEDFHPENPYKGLRAFQSGDNQDFFGREKVTSRLVKRLGEAGESGRFLAVVGPSGSGKSSLVKAGLIPALWRGELPGSEKWFVVEMLPGTRPLDELEIALTKVAANQAGNLHEHLQRDGFGLVRAASLILPNDESELVVVIDQFEEVFTLVEDEEARVHFLDLLVAAVHEPRSRVRVVITLRADFYDRPLHYPAFGELVRTRLETIMPLSAEELERAITRPADRVGVRFEPGLVAAIIGDVNYQPGALPLLQYALTELFEQRKGRMLTREGYQAIGGTVGALARRAEELYLSLNSESQQMARQLFLRLVTLGEGTEDTRRRAQRSELMAIAEDGEVMEEIIDLYAEYRLFALDTDPGTRSPTVEVAHEALLREWERLRAWLNESREDIRQERLLYTAAADWEANGRDASYLLSGTRLEQAEAWVDSTGMALTERERAFVKMGVEVRERQIAEAREQQIRETRLEQRSQTFLRGLVAVLLIAVVVALGLTSVAVGNANEAQNARNEAVGAFRNSERQRLALQADQAMDAGATGNVGFALAVRSLDYGYSPEADAALLRAVRQGTILRELPPIRNGVQSLSYSHDRQLIAATGEGGTVIIDAVTEEQLHLLSSDDIVRNAEFSYDGAILFTAGDTHISFWDTATWQETAVVDITGLTGWMPPAYLSPNAPDNLYVNMPAAFVQYDIRTGAETARYRKVLDGGQSIILVVHDETGTMRFVTQDGENKVSLVLPESGEPLCTLLESSGIADIFVSQSPAPGQYILINNNVEGKLYIRDFSCQLIRTIDVSEDEAGTVIYGWDIDPERGVVATGDSSNNIIRWDLNTGEELSRFQVVDFGFVKISPDGREMLVTRFETTYVWDVTPFTEPQIIHVGSPAPDVRIAPDGESFYITLFGAPYSRWTFDGRLLSNDFHFDMPIRYADLSPDGTMLAVSIEGQRLEKYSNYILDAETGAILHELTGHTELVNYIEFSPDGTQVLSGGFDNTARTWDARTGAPLILFAGFHDTAVGAFFSPDGTRILTISLDSTAALWDAASGELLQTFDNEGGSHAHAAFSPDGRLVAIGDTSGFVHVWDLETGEKIHRLVHPDAVWGVEFSPDGRTLATGSWDGTARIWDVSTERIIRSIPTGFDEINFVRFTPDGRYIINGSDSRNFFTGNDGPADYIQLWRVDLDEVIADYCARNPVELTEDQRTQYGLYDTPMCPEGA